MSLSQPTLANPSERTFQWSGSQGLLTWYDKENKRRVPVRMPFEFLVLDELSCIVGFNKLDNSAYWSNEVRNVSKEPLTVKTSRGVKQVGLYRELADVRAKGARYAKSIYIAHRDQTGQFVIGNFKATGSALTAWIELGKSHIIENGKVVLSKGEQQTAPTGPYFPPAFDWVHFADGEYNEAVELDKQLQAYLKEYFARQASEQESMFTGNDTIDPELGKATPEQIADFERRKAAGFSHNAALDLGGSSLSRSQQPVHAGSVAADDNDNINPDDIPF